MSPERRDLYKEMADEFYRRLFAEIEDEELAEHNRDFGPDVLFKPDGKRVHEKVMARIRKLEVE